MFILTKCRRLDFHFLNFFRRQKHSTTTSVDVGDSRLYWEGTVLEPWTGSNHPMSSRKPLGIAIALCYRYSQYTRSKMYMKSSFKSLSMPPQLARWKDCSNTSLYSQSLFSPIQPNLETLYQCIESYIGSIQLICK